MSRLAPLLVLVLWLLTPGTSKAEEALRHQPHCQAGLFCLAAERHGEEITLWLEVQTAEPLTLVVHPEAQGLDGPHGPLRLLSEQIARHAMARYRIRRAGDWRLDWRYSFHPGSEAAAHRPEGPYRLPYPPGTAYRVIQGAEGAFSHQGPLANAIDWAMPLGTEVRAARAGIVIGARAEGSAGGPDPALRGAENYLWIRHDDGTVGHYLHLLNDSLLVAHGQRVAAGQPIARSGDSGFSTEPHLHFHVATPSAEGTAAFESFPLRFDLGGNQAELLETGRLYAAPTP